MKEAKNWAKILNDTKKVENILTHEMYIEDNKIRIQVLLTQVAFEVYIQEIQKQNGTYQEKMRYDHRLDSIKNYGEPFILCDLGILYNVRNEYAHKLSPNKKLIKGWINGLQLWTEKTKKVPQKNKYTFASNLIMFKLQSGLEHALREVP